jgi:glycosyltransferase involved in cell wall biosynthesis
VTKAEPSPLVSVLMTAYNRERFIGAAIQSVISSSFRDLEIIVVDDNSNDSTVAITRRYAASDSRVKLHVNDSTIGDYANRNRAATLARGKYLKYLDSDDILYPYGLEFMVNAMEANPECALGLGREIPDPGDPFPLCVSPAEAFRRHFLESGLLDSGPTASILLAEKFRQVNGFDELRFVGDESTWLKLASRFPVLLLPRDLVWWRRHVDQEFSIGLQSGGYLEARFHVRTEALEKGSCPLHEPERRRALGRVRRSHSRALLRLALAGGGLSESLRLCRTSGLTPAEVVRYAFSKTP